MLAFEWDPDKLPDPACKELQITSFSSEVPSLHRLAQTTFHKLTVLKLSRIGLESLFGIDSRSFPNLRILFCSFNRVTDISPLLGHSLLETLDLEGNRISNSSNLEILASLPKLTELNVSGNPIESTKELCDESWIGSKLKCLRILNDEPISFRPVSTASTASSYRPMTARENDEIAPIVDQARRPVTARSDITPVPTLTRNNSSIGNPISWARSTGSSQNLKTPSTHPVSEKRGPVRVFPPLRRRQN